MKVLKKEINLKYTTFMERYLLFLIGIWLFTSCFAKPKNNSYEVLKVSQDQNTIVVEQSKMVKPSKTKSPSDIREVIRSKSKWFKTGVKPSIDLAAAPEGFLIFYKKFIKDSLYQRAHINFATIAGIIGECDTTIILGFDNWEFTTWDFTDYFSVDNYTTSIDGWENLYYSTANRFYYEFTLKEVGLIYQTGFELVDGEWMLTLYYVNAC